MAIYLIANGPMPTAASQVAVTTGTAIKTMLQVKSGLTLPGRMRIVEWGISFSGSVAAEPILCELMSTGTVAATVTAHALTGIQNIDPLGTAPTTSLPFTCGVATTGYTATAEGTITESRMLDCQLVAPTGQYVKQWPLGREPQFAAANFLRIRVKAAAAVNAICYVIIEV